MTIYIVPYWQLTFGRLGKIVLYNLRISEKGFIQIYPTPAETGHRARENHSETEPKLHFWG